MAVEGKKKIGNMRSRREGKYLPHDINRLGVPVDRRGSEGVREGIWE
jgi:hypothetical protein